MPSLAGSVRRTWRHVGWAAWGCVWAAACLPTQPPHALSQGAIANHVYVYHLLLVAAAAPL